MTLPAPTYVIFDMDGTTVRHINPWVLNALETADDIFFKIGSGINKLTGWRTKKPLGGVVTRGPEKKRRLLVHRALHSVRRRDLDKIVEPCPGVLDVLEFLKHRNIPVGLASNGLGKGYGHDVLSEFDFEQYFEVSIYREDIRHAKPHPEALLKAMSHFERPPGEYDVIWYIGDRWKDMQAAFAAQPLVKARIVPFAYGLNAALHAFIEGKLSAEQRVVDYADLLDLLVSLHSKTVEDS